MHLKMDCDLGDEKILMSEPLSSFQDQIDRIYVSGDNNVVTINITVSNPAGLIKKTISSPKPVVEFKEEIVPPQSPKVLSAQEQRARAKKWAEAEFGIKPKQKKKKTTNVKPVSIPLSCSEQKQRAKDWAKVEFPNMVLGDDY